MNKSMNVPTYLKERQKRTFSKYHNPCFILPLDVEVCDTCYIDILYNELNDENLNKLQTIREIALNSNVNIFSDTEGPSINIQYNNNSFNNNFNLFQNQTLSIQLQDDYGINMLEKYLHNVRYWFNDSQAITNLSPNLFNYTDCNSGEFQIEIPSNIENYNTLWISAWDGLNNQTLKSFHLNIFEDLNKNAIKIYNIPNPFSDYTFFTFWINETPAKATITIFSQSGIMIDKIHTDVVDGFNAIEWSLKNSKIHAEPVLLTHKKNEKIEPPRQFAVQR